MKRGIDVVFALAWLLLTAPLMLLIALLIKLESSGSVLYSQPMIGQHGKVFSLFRFRTMFTDRSEPGAEKRLTPVGALIRDLSFDHLPMLINLLKGDLTLVGPRPMEIQAVNFEEDPIWQQYFQVKPGLFNYAVLKMGKSWTPSRASRPRLNQALELEYRKKRSSITDFQLLIQFLIAYIKSRGNVKARGTPGSETERK